MKKHLIDMRVGTLVQKRNVES